jgi:hypothetical protein
VLEEQVVELPPIDVNLFSSITGRKSKSLKTRVDDGTNDSPTCGRGNNALSNTTELRPARDRYAAMLEPAGPPPMIPTSKSVLDITLSPSI